jgi:citrate lyase beta subunit
MTQFLSNQARAADVARFQTIEEMAELAASCWRSVAEGAFRGESATVAVHCRQIAIVTREAFALAKQLGVPPTQDCSA